MFGLDTKSLVVGLLIGWLILPYLAKTAMGLVSGGKK